MSPSTLLLIFFLVVLTAMAAATQQRVLLSKSVVPSHYNLSIRSDLQTCEFVGDVQINVRVVQTTKVIELHGEDLVFPEGSASFDGIKASQIELVPNSDGVVRVHFENDLEVKEGVLSFAGFSGKLLDNMKGYYRSQYTHSSGEKRYMGVTQFEATDARRAFPCWDEPAAKATFAISLTGDKTLTFLSNMPEVGRSQAADNEEVCVRFDTTPLMSTYLVAWVIGEFASLTATTKTGTQVSVFTAHDRAADGEFAMTTAVKVLEYFEDYYDMPYVLPKLDCVAVPDFAAGAMENWGLVTYRETALLVSAKESLASKQRVAYVVAHELAHQWFGNAVTMEWWRELWLNEGFATYAGQAAVAAVFPDWDMWTAFFSDYVTSAMRLDGLRSSHPIEVEVYTSSQISEIFDHISYLKGAAVIRLIAEAIGEEAFRDGLRIYLKKHKFGNAVTTDLWAALSKASGRDVAKLMSKWTGVTGYPVLKVDVSASNPAVVTIDQQRFFGDGQVNESSEASTNNVWDMILRIGAKHSDGNVATTNSYLADAHNEVALDGADYKWVLVNAGQTTFCRVAYSEQLAKGIVAALAAGEITNPVDRLGLINDAFALSRAGLTTTSSSLRLVGSFASETNYRVVSVLASWLGNVGSVWNSEPQIANIDSLIRQAFAPMFDRLTWTPLEGEDAENTLLRTLVISRLVESDHPATIAHARGLWQQMVEQGPDAVPTDLRSVIYSVAIKNGGVAEFDHVLNLYKTLPQPAERNKALVALGRTKDAELLTRFLKLGLTDEVRAQDTYLVFTAAGSNTRFPRAAWEFLKENWAELNKKLVDGLLARCVTSSVSLLVGSESIAEIENFFKENPCPVAERGIAQACESILVNTNWLERHRADVADFFNGPEFASHDIVA